MNKYRGSGELAAVIAERDALRAEVEQLRKEEDEEGREIGQMHDALADYRTKLAKARAGLKDISDEHRSKFEKEQIARQTLKEICE